MAPKLSISSPLEAGTSLLENQNLSTAITEALDYLSARLARKRLHLTLILTQEDVALPIASAAPSPCIHQSPRSPMSPLSPVANFFRRKVAAPSPILENPSPCSSSMWPSSPLTPRSPMTSGGLFSHPVNFSGSGHSRNRSLPVSPLIPPSPRQLPSPRLPTSPFLRPDYNMSQRSGSSASDCSTISSNSLDSGISTTSHKCRVKLIPAVHLPWKDAQILQESITKASHKHGVSIEISSTLENLIRRSLQQNRLIHTSEGLTVLALDRIYTLKLAIARYTYLSTAATLGSAPISTKSLHEALAEAVDELRLTVWAQQGASIDKGLILRSYDHLPITMRALREINSAYNTVTNKPGPITGVEVPSPPPLTSAPPTRPLPEPTATPRQPRRWHTTKEDSGKTYATPISKGPKNMVMRKQRLEVAERNRTAQLFLDSTSASTSQPEPTSHLHNARQRLQRPALPRINTAERKHLAEVPTPIERPLDEDKAHILAFNPLRMNTVSAHRQPSVKISKVDFTPITKTEWSFFIGDQDPKRGGVEVKNVPKAPHAMFPVPSPNEEMDEEGHRRKSRETFAAIPHDKHQDERSTKPKAMEILRMPEPKAILEEARQNARTRLNRPRLTMLKTKELQVKRNSKPSQPHLEMETPILNKEIKRLHSFRGMVKRMDSLVDRRGPKTPGGWEDCTPITKNEWSFFIGEQAPKIAAVETC